MKKIKVDTRKKLLDLSNSQEEDFGVEMQIEMGDVKPQVDFEALKNFIKTVEEMIEIGQEIPHPAPQKWGELENYKLFMEMMGKSSSFAHKAHKELRAIGKNEDHVVLHDMNYTFRNLPVNIGITCCIVGENNHRGIKESGILEWCTNEDDAASMLNKMKKYTQFSNLKIEIMDLDDTKSR